jgi:hypothetical protein
MGDKGYEVQFGASKFLYDKYIDDAEGLLESIQIPYNNSSASIANTGLLNPAKPSITQVPRT